MRLAKNFIPGPIDMTLAGTDAGGEPPLVDGDQSLWARQQERLASHRQRLAKLVAEQRSGANTGDEIGQVYRMITGRQHVISEWSDLWAVVVALSWLDPRFHRGLFTLGGWHSKGGHLPSGLRPAPADLLARLDESRYYAVAEDLRYSLEQKILISCNKSQPEHRKRLEDHLKVRGFCEFHLLEDLRGFREHLERKRAESLASVEDQLLFMDRRTFFFSPRRTDPSAGWRDFVRFAASYNAVASELRFRDYEWSVRLPRG